MSSPLALSLQQARRLALTAQGFAGHQPSGNISTTQLLNCIERLGVVQIDSVNALVRSHYLPLFSRLGDYPAGLLEQVAWGEQRPRKLFEYWGHEASLLPISLYPLVRWRMRRAASGEGIYARLARFAREQQPVVQRVLMAVQERGALGAGSLSSREVRAGPWWDWSVEKRALEWLFASGEVTVAGRRGFERLYDLPERVIPAAVLALPELNEAQAQRQLLLRAAAALGVACEKDLRDYYRFTPADSRARLAELLEAGELHQVQVEGWRLPGYCLAAPKSARRVSRSALLSPFDSLIWARERTERLFNFRYRLELYTPQHKRQYGYYVLPFLHNEQLLARLDLRAERGHGRLAVHALHEEESGLDAEGMAALALHLRNMACWLGLDEVAITCKRPGTLRLQAALAGL